MNILVYNGPWQLAIEQAPDPRPKPGEVLVRSDAVGICGSDVHGFTGESGRRKAGMVMGHEAAGTVMEAGPGVANLKPGDRVAVFPTVGCGVCSYCQAGLQHICPDKRILGVNAGRWGAMAEYFTCQAGQAYPLAPGTEPEIGILAEPIAVALHAIRRMDPALGSPLAVVGAGTIGLAVVAVLRDMGHGPVFALDTLPEKLGLARGFGAIPIDVTTPDYVAAVKQACGGRRPAGVFEAVGAAATVRTAYDLCDSGGTIVLIGNLAKEFTLPLQGVTSNETTLRGSYGFTQKEFQEGVDFVSRRRADLGVFITGSCSLGETPTVMTQLAKGELKALKMVIHPGGARCP